MPIVFFLVSSSEALDSTILISSDHSSVVVAFMLHASSVDWGYWEAIVYAVLNYVCLAERLGVLGCDGLVGQTRRS